MSDRPELWVAQLGCIPYAEALALQEDLRSRRQADELPDVLLLLEHPPVYTRGRRTEPTDLPMGADWCRDQGIEVHDVDRGGRVTYHGPGQIVGYPIMKIDGVREFVAAMERAMIAALADEGIEAEVREGLTGVWVGDRKIGSIGVHVQRGVTTHGLAINVDNDLTPFEWIVPCGIGGVAMTSIERETGRGGDSAGGFNRSGRAADPETGAGAARVRGSRIGCFRKRLAWRFAQAYGRRQRIVSQERLRVPSVVA